MILTAVATKKGEQIPIKCKWKRVYDESVITIKDVNSFSYIPSAEDIGYKIDSKIDKIFPGYKEKITSGIKKIYTNIKERLTELYISITNKICTNNPTLCEDAREGFASMKESFGITWDMLKGIYNNSKEKVSDWYLEYKSN